MGFLDTVVKPDGTTGVKSTPTQGFLSSVVLPTNPAEAQKIQGYAQNAQQLQDQANQAGSFGSIAKQTLVTPVVDVAKKMYGAAKSAFTEAPQQSFDTKPLDVGAGILSSTIKDSGDRLQNAVATIADTHKSLLEKGVATGEAGMGIVNALFSPVTSSLATVSAMPVVGYVADGVNAFFGALGAGGSEVASKAVDGLPLSQQTKDTIRPLASEIGALTAQIIGGKAGADVYAKIAEKTKIVTDTIAQDPIVQNPHSIGETPKPIEPQVKGGFLDTVQKPSETPKTAPESTKPVEVTGLVDSTGKQGIRDVMTNLEKGGYSKGQISAIAGKLFEDNPTGRFTPKEVSDVARLMEPNNPPVLGGTIKENPKFNPAKVAKIPQTTVPKVAENTKISSVPKVSEAKIPEIQTVEGLKPSKVAKSIEAKAIEQNLTKSFENVAGYDPITIKDQALRAADVMKNMDTARQMVKGEIPLASGLRAEALIKAMEDHAQATGDVKTLQEIANSPLTSETSAHAQALRLLAERNPDSVVTKLRKIKSERQKLAEKKGGSVKKEISNMKETIKKSASKKETWESFISELKCNI